MVGVNPVLGESDLTGLTDEEQVAISAASILCDFLIHKCRPVSRGMKSAAKDGHPGAGGIYHEALLGACNRGAALARQIDRRACHELCFDYWA